jgi:hypothetical protein
VINLDKHTLEAIDGEYPEKTTGAGFYLWCVTGMFPVMLFHYIYEPIRGVRDFRLTPGRQCITTLNSEEDVCVYVKEGERVRIYPVVEERYQVGQNFYERGYYNVQVESIENYWVN